MFSMPKKFKQIKRLYIYQFNGAPESNDFDAGLIRSTTRCARATRRQEAHVGDLPRRSRAACTSGASRRAPTGARRAGGPRALVD